MKKYFKKLEETLDNYVSNLETKPVKTIIKTLVIVWLILQVKKMLK